MEENIFGFRDVALGKALSKLLNQFAKLSNSKIIIQHVDQEVHYTLKELQFLNLIQENPGLKNIDISNALQVTKGMISKIIKNLEEREVVLKKINPDNNREIQLFITDLGRSHLINFTNTIFPTMSEISMEWLLIPKEFRDIFQNLIDKYTGMLVELDSK